MNWKDSYKAALLEVDPIRLLNLIRTTELMMTSRSDSLLGISNEEREEINDATCCLHILKGHAGGAGV